MIYLTVGMIPIGMALATNILAPGAEHSTLPTLAGAFLHPALAVIFVVALLSAILSTIDSAIIAPASVLSQNVLLRIAPNKEGVGMNRLTTSFVALASVATAYAGESAYDLLESAYALTLVGLATPLLFGIYTTPRSARPALSSMIVGCTIWLVDAAFGWGCIGDGVGWPLAWRIEFPIELIATAAAIIVYLAFEPPWRMQRARNDRQ
jgi:Na+/proline symporter